MRFGTIVVSSNAKEAVEFGVLTEKLGYDSFFVTDHLVDISGTHPDPWSIIGTVAGKTRRIFMCSDVTDTQRCHPAKLAHIVATLDRLSGGRVGLGIGAGEAMNLIPFGIPFEEPRLRAERLAEAVQVVKLLWNATRRNPASFRGKFYNLSGAWLDQDLPRPPPVYIGALGARRTLEVVGRHGDGWITWINTPETYARKLEVIRSAAKDAGRDPGTIDAVAPIYATLSDDDKIVRDLVNLVKRSLIIESNTLKTLGIKVPEEVKESYQNLIVNDEIERVLTDVQDSVPDEIAFRILSYGSIENIVEKIYEYKNAGMTHAIIYFPDREEESVRTFSREALPLFREEHSTG